MIRSFFRSEIDISRSVGPSEILGDQQPKGRARANELFRLFWEHSHISPDLVSVSEIPAATMMYANFAYAAAAYSEAGERKPTIRAFLASNAR